LKTHTKLKKSYLYGLVIFGCILAVLVSLYGIFVSISNKSIDLRQEQFAAERWMNDESLLNYAQISCFLTANAGFNKSNILSLSRSYDERMISESISSQSDGRLWIHAYSGQGKVNVDSASNIQTDVTAVGNDFFFFHNIQLLSGSYFTDDPLNNDHVIISEYLAWLLYGSFDVIGKDLFISNVPYYICGVSKDEYSKGGTAVPHIYMQYDIYEKMDSSAFISCYEVLLPDPISEFALSIVKSYISFNVLEYEIIQNTSRFSILNTFKNLGSLSQRNIKTNKVIYPEWENSARITEQKLAYFLLIQIIVLFLIAITLIVMTVIYRKNIYEFLEQLLKKIKTKTKNMKIAKAISNKRRKKYEEMEFH
jgi:hypothetical protein